MKKLSNNIMVQVRTAVRENPDALVAVLDANGVFVFISPSVKKILGFEIEVALGHNYRDFFPPPQSTRISLTMQDAYIFGESLETTRITPLKAGGHRRMRGSFVKVVDENTGENFVLSIARPLETVDDPES